MTILDLLGRRIQIKKWTYLGKLLLTCVIQEFDWSRIDILNKRLITDQKIAEFQQQKSFAQTQLAAIQSNVFLHSKKSFLKSSYGTPQANLIIVETQTKIIVTESTLKMGMIKMKMKTCKVTSRDIITSRQITKGWKKKLFFTFYRSPREKSL